MQWKIAAVLTLTAACLVWFLWGIDPEVVQVSLGSVRWGWVGAAVAGYVAVHAIRSVRLQALVAPEVGLLGYFSVNCIGYLAINVIPLRLGEFVRPYLLLEQHRVPFGRSLAGIFLERLLDMLSLVVMLLLVTLAVDLPPGGVVIGEVDVVSAGQRAAGAVVAVGAAGLAVVIGGGEGLVALVERLLGGLPVLGERLPAFIRAFQSGARGLLDDPRRGAWVLLNTAAMWVTQVVAVWAGIQAFPDLPGGLEVALTSWSITLSGMTVMPTPGFFGPFEAFCAAGLLLFGVEADLARTYAVVHHLTLFGFTVVIGLAFLLREGLSLTGVVRASREAAGGASAG
jgi:uncharacterized protein (TIRG00374 family)